MLQRVIEALVKTIAYTLLILLLCQQRTSNNRLTTFLISRSLLFIIMKIILVIYIMWGWNGGYCNMRGLCMRMIIFTLFEASLKFHPKHSLLFHGNPHPDRKNHESVKNSFKEKCVKIWGWGINHRDIMTLNS